MKDLVETVLGMVLVVIFASAALILPGVLIDIIAGTNLTNLLAWMLLGAFLVAALLGVLAIEAARRSKANSVRGLSRKTYLPSRKQPSARDAGDGWDRH